MEKLFDVRQLSAEYQKGLTILAKEYGFAFSNDGVTLRVAPCQDGFSVECKDGVATIAFAKKCWFFAAFSYLLQRYGENFSLTKTPQGELGIMRDSARNGIFNESGLQELTVYAALMGYTYIGLYVEDLLEIEKYPYMGLHRGRYKREELKRMDDFADVFGIELIPYAQSLAHLPHVFLHDAFADINDTDDVLLVDDEKTYEFLDEVFAFLRDCFRTGKINAGMDEAHNLCKGKYRDKHGYTADRVSPFLKHVERVLSICRKYGFAPSIWSDMIFKVAFDIHTPQSYVQMDGKRLDEAFVQAFPKDVQLVFWDYYHTNQDFYDDVLSRHFEITDNVAFAGGVWSWCGFAPFNTLAEKTLAPALESCKKYGCKNFLLTSWGNGGGECMCMLSASTFLYAANEWLGGADDLNERALTIFGNTYDDLKKTELVDRTRENGVELTAERGGANPSKYLLYNDPLCGVMDANARWEMKDWYVRNSQELKAVAEKKGKLSRYFETLYLLSRCLEIKSTLGLEITDAYKKGDRETLRHLAKNVLPLCLQRFEAFATAYRKLWLESQKSFGLETIDIRFGAMKRRLQSVSVRLLEYLDGKTERIEELEQKRLPPVSHAKAGDDIEFNTFMGAYTGSWV